MQGEQNIISDLYSHIKAFRTKLIFFQKQLKDSNLTHFECCQIMKAESRDVQFPVQFAQTIISHLHEQFSERFADIDKKADLIQCFQNSIEAEVEKVPSDIQMELIDLQSNEKCLHFSLHLIFNSFHSLF